MLRALLMPTSGSYPWTILPVEKRKAYMAAFEAASVDNTIVPFTNLLAKLVKTSHEGKPGPRVP